MFQVNKQDALRIAPVFLNSRGVRAVEVFGSVARSGEGNDLDLAVVVEGAFYASYVIDLREQMGYGDYYADYKYERRTAALEALYFTTAQRGWLESVTAGIELDLHLLPMGWKKQTDLVQRHLPHDDLNFVSKIAKEAVTLECRGDSAMKRVLWP